MEYNNYDIVKATLPAFRKETASILKPRGFDVTTRIYKNSYYKDCKVRMQINVPSWFDYYDQSIWNINDKGRKLETSLKNRLINMILENSNKKVEGYEWFKASKSIWTNMDREDPIFSIERCITLDFAWDKEVY